MFLFITLLITIILGGAEVDLFTPAFPELMHTFQLTPFTLQLMMSINFIGYCSGCLVTGFLGDRYGPRNIILITLGIFIVGSILCVTAPHYYVLLLGRLLQGLGMSGPVVLSYVIIAHLYPLDQQAKLMGILNGITAGAMAFAPVVGSYITYYAGWRGNFTALLILSIVSLILCLFTLPKIKPDSRVHLSLRAYIPLLKSKMLMIYSAVICAGALVYWTFVAFSPVLYMEDLKVGLKDFGIYQGVLAGAFSIISICMPVLFRWARPNTWLKAGTWLALICILGALALGIWVTDNPLWITLLLIGFSIGIVFPMNILWPVALTVVPNAKSRAAAFMMAVRLLFTGIGLEVTGYYYNHTFFPLALFMGICMVISFWLVRYLPEWKNRA
jgi:DHA1 family bicyclomycin/chloramphenicol resistance-like MFS transporter